MTPPKDITAETLRERFSWKKVEAPKNWRPTHNGEELLGYYAGRSKRDGKFGQYEVVMVIVPKRGTFFVSGTRLIQLVDAAMVDVGHPIRIVFAGWQTLAEREDDAEPRRMKLFEVFVAEGEALDADYIRAAHSLAFAKGARA